ncbi:MAG TPA: TatD family hydrolase, partial [Ktedonobacterales bacterium]
RRLGLPAILHVRGAEARAAVRTLLAVEGVGAGAVIHYFVGDLAAARAWLALGCHLSVGRPATRPHETALRAALASDDVPLDRLLIETDTEPLPGRTTEPADVVAVAEAIATLKSLPLAEVAARTTATFAALFGG